MPLLAVVGPTGSGKTELAVRLAELLDGEVISADSVQVYRGFDIGSGKPTPDELARAPHHLVGSIDPLEPMDAARWAECADEAVKEIARRGKVPIVCGGTFLYIKALVYGLAAAPPANDEVRERHRQLVEAEGRAALHSRLAQVDPTAASRLEPNDFVRVSRALEVYELSGTPISEWQRQHGFRRPRIKAKLIGLSWAREDLNMRISRRVQAMLNSGWVEEVRGLVSAGYGSARAMQAVGYKQVAGAIGEPAGPDTEALHSTIGRATRIFARRQRTWLRDEPVQWLDPRPDTQVLRSCAEGADLGC